jgi:predicted acetyltransferase
MYLVPLHADASPASSRRSPAPSPAPSLALATTGLLAALLRTKLSKPYTAIACTCLVPRRCQHCHRRECADRQRRYRCACGVLQVLLPDTHFSAAAGTLTVRRATMDDAASLALVTSYGFASNRSLQSIADDPFGRQNRRPVGEAQEDFDEQTWGAFEGDRAVSQLKAHAWTISGGTNCDVAAVTGVATLPEFRRLGLLRTMMGLLFHDMRSRGQPVAALLATQAAIYQRYGYREAVRDARSYSIDPVDVAFVDGDGGSYKVGREPMEISLEPILRRLYKEFTAGRAGCYDWDNGGWVRQGIKAQLEQGGMESKPPTYCAIARDATGEARGYCFYVLNHGIKNTDANALNHGSHPTRNQMLMSHELIYTDLNAYRSLWTFLSTKHDLVGNITIAKVPGDDPAPTVFLEPRLLRTKVEAEGTWWRIVDVKGALEARSYTTALGDTLKLAVEDDERLAPWNIGELTLGCSALHALCFADGTIVRESNRHVVAACQCVGRGDGGED